MVARFAHEEMNRALSLFDEILRVLSSSLSPINARGALERAVSRMGLQPNALTSAHVGGLIRELRVALRLFLDPEQTTRILQEIDRLGGNVSGVVAPVRVEIHVETDVAAARRVAREMCERVRARTFAAQKILTIVSEVGRNIAVYSHGGSVELRAAEDRMQILARDRGPGITNLTQILAGQYRSRTGLGMGILGVKRLADRFDITTSSSGTEIQAEVRL